jgi:P4 family phage/plasmid primase-like protien
MNAEVGKKLNSIALKLKNAPFKKHVMNECATQFKVPTENFTDKLDSLHHIIGFENGVFDLKEMRFRDGKPEDFVRLSVGYDFAPKDDKVYDDIMRFVGNITPNDAVRDYVLGVQAYNVSGNKYMEQAWFFTGHGRNGKGTLMTLLEQTLRKGQYYHEGDVAVLTNIKKDANSASSAIMALKNKRVAVFSESEDKDETIKVKILKQIVGRDLIQGREMYAKKTVEFRPTFSLLFLMNDMPKLSKLESNLMEKINVIKFPYRFCDYPQGDNEKHIDRTIKDKFQDDVRYRQQYMNILIDYYVKFGICNCQPLQPPEEVKNETKIYFEENNEVGMWLNQQCIITNNKKDMITPTELYLLFKQDNATSSIRDVRDFGKSMSFNKFVLSSYNGSKYYKGIKYNDYKIQDDDDNDDYEC